MKRSKGGAEKNSYASSVSFTPRPCHRSSSLIQSVTQQRLGKEVVMVVVVAADNVIASTSVTAAIALSNNQGVIRPDCGYSGGTPFSYSTAINKKSRVNKKKDRQEPKAEVQKLAG